MLCKNCGKEILEQDKFCSYCGTKVEEEIVDLSDEADEAPVWNVFAKIGHVLSLVAIIGGALTFGVIGIEAGIIGIVFSGLGLKSKENYYKAKIALNRSILGTILSVIIYTITVYILCYIIVYYMSKTFN